MRNPNGANKYKARLAFLVVGLFCLIAALFGAQSHYYSLERYIALEEAPIVTSAEETTVAEAPAPMLTFSIENVFVHAGDSLELTLPGHLADHAEILYTLDGTHPAENGTLYTGPIIFGEIEGRGSWLVKAQVVQNGTASEVYERIYLPEDTAVLGDGIFIVLLYGNDGDFYNEETGILARGAESAEAALENEDLPWNRHGDDRANYYGKGKEYERAVRVEVINAQGERALIQNAGIRVTGGQSRSHGQKSLRLYARREYDADTGKFDVTEIYPGLTSVDGSETPANKLNHLDLRNGGNDYAATMLSDAAMRVIAARSGLGTVGQPVPAVVYLNGEYYGFAWLQPDYSEKNIADIAGLETPENIQILEEAEHYAASADDETAVDDYLDFYNFALGDMTKQRNADRLEEMVDMDELLLYYALELYANNQDWPHNNYKVWRYVGATNEEKATNPYADGRWRFLFYDLDYAFGTHSEGAEGFEWALGLEQSPMLKSILRNQGFRDRFVNIYCRLLATTLSTGGAGEIVYGLKDTIEPELQYRESTDPDQLVFDKNYRQVLYLKLDDYLARRPDEIYSRITEYFGLESMYTLTVQSPETGATLWLDGYAYRDGEGLTAPFYNGTAVTFTPELADGWVFDGWELNGELVTSETLVLGPFGEDDDIGPQTVRLLVRRQSEGQAVISAVSYRNDWNWISFTNVGTEPFNLSKAYLTKDSEIIYVFPNEILQPGESFVVLEQSNALGEENRGEYIADFKFRKDDDIRLHASNGRLLDTVKLPRKNVGYIYHHSHNSAAWVWSSIEDYEEQYAAAGGGA